MEKTFITFRMSDGQELTYMGETAKDMWFQFQNGNTWIEGQYEHDSANAVTSKVLNSKYIVDVEYTVYK